MKTTIPLTKEDYAALEYIGGRYEWSSYLNSQLDYDSTDSINDLPMIMFNDEYQLWEFQESVENDDGFLTLLSPDSELYMNIVKLLDSIV